MPDPDRPSGNSAGASRPPLFFRPPPGRRAAGAMLSALVFLAAAPVAAEVYQPPAAFLAEAFAGDVPAPEVLWITSRIKPAIKAILGHDPGRLRLRYWRRGRRTAWILEEIGKYKPITTGVVVVDGRIERLRVLIYRESHGWEVRYPFFTDQFRNARLLERRRLSRNIDSISGATLSVGALERVARLALFLHDTVTGGGGDGQDRDE